MSGATASGDRPGDAGSGRRHCRRERSRDRRGAYRRGEGAESAGRRSTPRARAKHLHGVANAIEAADFTRCAELMVREMGKPYPEAIGEIANCAPIFRYYAEMARDEAGKIAGTDAGRLVPVCALRALRRRRVHIMPYNFPVLLMCWTVAASLAAGNACIIKPAEATTLSTLRLYGGVPLAARGLVLLPAGRRGDGQGAGRVRPHPCGRLHRVGGGGRRVAVACAERTKPCVIEAGGSDPLIVSAHAPLEVAAARLGDGRLPSHRPGLHLGRALLRRRFRA